MERASLMSSCMADVAKDYTDEGLALPQLSQEIFLGIRFASTALPRFERARSLNTTWTGTIPAVEFGLTCSGFGTNPRENWPTGEDCLNLNVARPAGTHSGSNLPVLVWIYGGGFRQGAIRDPEFNISYIVQTAVEIHLPVIVVAINYRLSGFGFLGSKGIVSAGLSNLGIRDQFKALEWIKENIQGFGGDPSKVTVWGESAGAISVADLSMAYGGDNSGLFHAGIMNSGNAFASGPQNLALSQSVYDNVTNATGCFSASDSLQCLRDCKSSKFSSNRLKKLIRVCNVSTLRYTKRYILWPSRRPGSNPLRRPRSVLPIPNNAISHLSYRSHKSNHRLQLR